MQISELMNMAGQFRERMADTEREAASLRVDGEAGGGLVRVTVDGLGTLVRVHIDPAAAANPSELSLLEDLIRAACNGAVVRAREQMRDRFGGMAQALGVDLGSLAPGGTPS